MKKPGKNICEKGKCGLI